MRHRVYGKKLGRSKNQRKALFKNLVQSLLVHGQIQTTETKAKAIKGLVDKIINHAKNPPASLPAGTAGRAGKNTQKLLAVFLQDKKVIEKLIKEIVPQTLRRNSGYTSVVKMGPRRGDGAMMVKMNLLTEEVAKKEKAPKVSKKKKVSVKK